MPKARPDWELRVCDALQRGVDLEGVAVNLDGNFTREDHSVSVKAALREHIRVQSALLHAYRSRDRKLAEGILSSMGKPESIPEPVKPAVEPDRDHSIKENVEDYLTRLGDKLVATAEYKSDGIGRAEEGARQWAMQVAVWKDPDDPKPDPAVYAQTRESLLELQRNRDHLSPEAIQERYRRKQHDDLDTTHLIGKRHSLRRRLRRWVLTQTGQDIAERTGRSWTV